MGKILDLILVVVFLPWIHGAIDPTCNYKQMAKPKVKYYIYNAEYPKKYVKIRSCRWWAESAPGTTMTLNCQQFDLPVSTNCVKDRMDISLTGDLNFRNAHKYCGVGTFSITSQSNSMTIGYTSVPGTVGGKFLCTLTVNVPANKTIEPGTTCDCGWQNTMRIVGGTATGVNQFPMVSAVVEMQSKSICCGATIIAPRYAISAGHCLTDSGTMQLRNASLTGLLVGDWDVSTGMDTTAAKLYGVEKFIIHPNYEYLHFKNDIGIVKTTRAITFSREVGPACLPFNYKNFNLTGKQVAVLGWGTLSFSGPKSDIIQRADLEVISMAQCNLFNPNLQANQFCTYYPKRDACQADSGGPIFWWAGANKRTQLMGIISYGKACATKLPGVNLDVRPYLDWIISVTPDANYCKKD